jgi:hypothetical protein
VCWSEAAQDPMFALLGTPGQHKVHRIYPGGHGMYGLYVQEARNDILAWLDRYLGRVR